MANNLKTETVKTEPVFTGGNIDFGDMGRKISPAVAPSVCELYSSEIESPASARFYSLGDDDNDPCGDDDDGCVLAAESRTPLETRRQPSL